MTIRDLWVRNVRPIRNWCEWLRLWKEATTLEQMIGLLHCGFAVNMSKVKDGEPQYDNIDRIIFYLETADHWTEDHVCRSLEELRQSVATKAFSMLCANVFNMTLPKEREDEHYYKLREITAERLFPFIQSFFMIEKPLSAFRIRNFPYGHLVRNRGHQEKIIIEFLLGLAQSIWISQAQDLHWALGDEKTKIEAKNEETQKRLDSTKPWLVEVLLLLGRLDLLEIHILDLDQSCLDRLKKIAMRSNLSCHHHPVDVDRPVANLEEARIAGSPAAWFLLRYDVTKMETARLQRMRDTEHKEAEAEDEIKELTPKK